MNTPFVSQKVRIENDPKRGRCVFANEPLTQKEVLERALTIPLPEDERPMHDASIIWHYYCVTEPFLPNHTIAGHLLLGIGSICNHSDSPNAILRWTENNCGVWATLEVLNTIEAHEEVTIKYTNILDYIKKGLISPLSRPQPTSV